jgi:chromate transporter
MAINNHINFLKEVFFYTLTAFGGPQVHYGILLKKFVYQKNYLTEQELVEYNSMCQILPGASSTQLITLIGYKKGGFPLAILTFIIWILPACTIMGALSFFVTTFKDKQNILLIFRFFEPMAIGFLLYAAFKSRKVSVYNTITVIIMLASTIITYLFFKTPWVFPALIILAGISTNFSNKRIPKTTDVSIKSVKWTNLVLFIIIFSLAAFFSETARTNNWENRKAFNLFENFYRFGSIVFGGGDVLFPMLLDQYVVRPSDKEHAIKNPNAIKIERNDLVTGYGIVRAVPGPVFSLASYAGGMAMSSLGKKLQLLGCLIASIAIFLPSALLVFFFFPLLQYLKKFVVVYRSLEGINAAVVGFMFAAGLYLTYTLFSEQTSSVFIYSLLITLGTFFLLHFTKIPSQLIVILCIALGWIF